MAFKPSIKNKLLRPGTPYPKISGDSIAMGSGGSNQLTTMGSGLSSNSIPDAASSNSFTTFTSTNHGNMLAAENIRLCHELEELKTRDLLSMARAGGTSNADTPTAGGLAAGRIILDRERLNWLFTRNRPKHDRTYRRRYPGYEPSPVRSKVS